MSSAANVSSGLWSRLSNAPPAGLNAARRAAATPSDKEPPRRVARAYISRQLAERDMRIADLEARVAEQDIQVVNVSRELVEREVRIQELEKYVAKQDAALLMLRKRLSEVLGETSNLDEEFAEELLEEEELDEESAEEQQACERRFYDREITGPLQDNDGSAVDLVALSARGRKARGRRAGSVWHAAAPGTL
eukprot:CAMPEP_0179189326 /NCGR_PEP_ID=MMETSP0796-20121207/93983_1 /TAXON_ID=73915 /ORGANISM="Pyrodinium bahamense, Strain pbaha01" /LENGTH=192 /DNA_ID=CAMNT_0020893455 /DNA_START=83 /DNA_END=658 /DNA_ORIENTATION=-